MAHHHHTVSEHRETENTYKDGPRSFYLLDTDTASQWLVPFLCCFHFYFWTSPTFSLTSSYQEGQVGWVRTPAEVLASSVTLGEPPPHS